MHVDKGKGKLVVLDDLQQLLNARLCMGGVIP